MHHILNARNVGFILLSIFILVTICLTFRGGFNIRAFKTQNSSYKRSYHLDEENRLIDEMARSKLVNAIECFRVGKCTDKTMNDKKHNFQDVIPSVYIHPKLAHVTDGRGADSKYYIAPTYLKSLNTEGIVYSIGNADEINFELDMSKEGLSVFSFDCTTTPKSNWKSFKFYPWCVGKKQSFENNVYSKGLNEDKLIFKSLSEIKRLLGHHKIDILKIDIEGFEWDVIENEIIQGKEADLPDQLLFELHTEGANPAAVPAALVKGKSRFAVTSLMLKLFDRGYRVANFEFNEGDGACAEFAMIRFV